jgi:three-Cys-motif partner protein
MRPAARAVEPHEFGGSWTEDKLKRVAKYLCAYTRIFAKGKFASRYRTIYVDAFAGTGYRTRTRSRRDGLELFTSDPDRDVVELLDGSAINALKVEPGFNRYIFVESDSNRAAELRTLAGQFPEKAAGIEVYERDANTYLLEFCSGTDWNVHRAVVFLDPYAMEVDWATIECLANTKAVDLWLLFPMSAVNRLLVRTGEVPQSWAAALTRLLGGDDWRTAFYTDSATPTLFGTETKTSKQADPEAIRLYFERKLRNLFPKVAVAPKPLMNSKNSPLFLLCFAAANPGRGGDIAVGIATDILRA